MQTYNQIPSLFNTILYWRPECLIYDGEDEKATKWSQWQTDIECKVNGIHSIPLKNAVYIETLAVLIHASLAKATNMTEQELQEIVSSFVMFMDDLPEMPTLVCSAKLGI